ncbi:unnamed protein product [Darwinula stevensoni]|uniref:Uncharacterized protein n=1 Tax=Darwinula stevensoni TaxID=69355 RepID=A0A7R8X8Y8_9CRUS|nr:unnamed protein product [Darwinula stevensoni]CAG0885007.1 unnamed protein product [Darwinula stevensoni]
MEEGSQVATLPPASLDNGEMSMRMTPNPMDADSPISCSFEADPGLDGTHSSEEELEGINGHPESFENGIQSGSNMTGQMGPEHKRKWNRSASSASSDEELIEFRASPPAHAHKPAGVGIVRPPPSKQVHREPDSWGSEEDEPPPRAEYMVLRERDREGRCISSSPPILSSHLRTQGASSSSSPRKRHRQGLHDKPPRPCLDFEKMQQKKVRAVTTWRESGELALSCW